MISTLGINIKKIRQSKGLTGTKLAALAGVGSSSISQIETGKIQSLHMYTVAKIAAALSVSMSDLLTDTSNTMK